MKRSEIPTDYLLLAAYTNSEWDNCSFAIVQLTSEYKTLLQQRLACLPPLQQEVGFNGLCFWDASVGFYTDTADDTALFDLLPEEERSCFIILDHGEPDILPVPESRIDTHQLILTPDGSAYFSAYGKHTGEEFWTASFDVGQLVST